MSQNVLGKNLHVSYKKWQEYSRQYQLVRKKNLAKEVKSALSLCDISNFTPTAVHLKNRDTDETILLNVETSKYNSPPLICKVSPDSDHDKLVATL